jgi:putative glutamine amidotransferase
MPLILVSPSVEKCGVEFNDLSASLSIKYESAVLQAGGIPVVVPMTTDRVVLAETLRRVDGVLLTGGDDINPELYETKVPRALRKTVDETPDGGGRDLRELILLDEIFRQRKPLLAICRGHQMLNIALGGKLIVDIARQVPGAVNHQRMDKSCDLVHHVPVAGGSLLSRIIGGKTLGINSSHHQAVMEPAGPLTAVARTRDGVVEAMELQPEAAGLLPFLMSVQFHPERLTDRYAEHRALFKAFVRACRQNGGKNPTAKIQTSKKCQVSGR